MLKFRQAGLPLRYLLEDIMSLTPQTVQRVINDLVEEQSYSAAAQAAAFGVTTPQGQQQGQSVTSADKANIKGKQAKISSKQEQSVKDATAIA
jgi:hypothetical protein